MLRRLTSAAFAAVVLACHGGDPPGPAAPQASSASPPAPSVSAPEATSVTLDAAFPTVPSAVASAPPADAGPPPSNPIVTLVSDGRVPMATLRYHTAAGIKQTVTIAADVSTTVSDAKRTKGNTTKLTVALTVTDVASDGVAQADCRLDAVEHGSGAAGTNLDPGFVPGSTAKLVDSGRGIFDVSALRPQAPAGADAQGLEDGFRETMAMIIVPLPVEPVGVGARWDAERASLFGGSPERQVTHYELVSMSRDHLRLRFTTTREIGPMLAPPGEGVTFAPVAMGSTGSGTAELDLSRLAVVSSRRQETLRAAVDAAALGGTTAPIHSEAKVDMTLRIESR